MASVKSSFRSFIKPILFKLVGEKGYSYFQYLGKLRDIEKRLVEEEELALLPQIIKEEDEVIDVGANYAYITHRLANICKKGKVYAFEPIPFTYNVCKRIVEKHQFKNVELYHKGVGNKNEEMEFSAPLINFGGISAGQAHMVGRNNELAGKEEYYQFNEAKTFKCDVVTIDSFLPNIKNLTFVKIDIEGAELFALQGMKETLKKWKPVIMLEITPFFLSGFNLKEQDVRDFFQPLDYLFFKYDKTINKLIPYKKSSFEDSNYIMLHTVHINKLSHLIQNN